MILALVHFGRKLPRYAKRNILLMDETFPSIDKILIHDSPRYRRFISKTKFKSRTTNLSKELLHLSGSSHNLEFRKGFWFTSLYRLIAVCELAEESNSPVLHVENDILIFPNFPFSIVNNSTKIMWCQFNEDRDVASLFYIPDSKSANWLKNEIIRRYCARPSHTDMSLLREIALENPLRIGYFPIADEVNSNLFADRVNQKTREENTKDFEKFGGIFDSAPLGMYWIGRDPRNHRGKLVRFAKLPESFISAEVGLFNFEFFNPAIETPRKGIPVFNLHVHAKIPKIFSINGLSKFKVKEPRTSQKYESKFIISIFLMSASSYLYRNLVRIGTSLKVIFK